MGLLQWLGFFKSPRTVNELILACPTPKSLAWWVSQNVEWIHIQDRWMPSVETLKKRKTDCCGFAVLFHDCLKALAYEPRIIEYHWDGNGHAICTFKSDKWYYTSNGVLHTCSKVITNLKELMEMESPHCDDWRECDTEGYNV